MKYLDLAAVVLVLARTRCTTPSYTRYSRVSPKMVAGTCSTEPSARPPPPPPVRKADLAAIGRSRSGVCAVDDRRDLRVREEAALLERLERSVAQLVVAVGGAVVVVAAGEASSAASAGAAARAARRAAAATISRERAATRFGSRAGTISPLHAQLSAPSSSSSLVLADVWLDAHSRASSMALA